MSGISYICPHFSVILLVISLAAETVVTFLGGLWSDIKSLPFLWVSPSVLRITKNEVRGIFFFFFAKNVMY